MRNALKQTKGPKLSLLSLQKNHTSPSQDLIDQLNEAMDDPSSATVSSKHYEPCELSSLMNNSKNCLPLFYLNISSLPFHIEELSTIISEHDLGFDIFGESETKLKLNKVPLNSVILSGYNFQFTTTECSSGGTAICIKKGLNYKLRRDLEIYKSIQLESTFIEVNLKTKNSNRLHI